MVSMKSAVSSVGLAVILILLSRYTLTLIGTVQYLIKINQSNDIVIEQHVQVGNDIGSRQPISYLAIYDYEQRARTIIDEDAKNV